MKKILFAVVLAACSLGTVTAQTRALDYATRMAADHMTRYPRLGDSEPNKWYRWNYPLNLMSNAYIELWKVTGDQTYYNYVKAYTDEFISPEGVIKLSERNGKLKLFDPKESWLDNVACPFLFDMGDPSGKFEKAIELIYSMYAAYPRTKEGAFWHKDVYPHQVWLDGLYMGSPFYTRYAAAYGRADIFDEVVTQFAVTQKHTWDPKMQLNFHAWDESRSMYWADPVTGLSKNYWSRSIGWYMMGMVDVLEYLPAEHPRRAELLKIFSDVAAGVAKYQDKSGAWWQVPNFPGREGNYLEASGTAMFTYAYLKGVRLGYLPAAYRKNAEKGLAALEKEFVRKDDKGLLSLTQVCEAAGLGGNRSLDRDGTYKYYISEPILTNDPKGMGAYLLAWVEAAKAGIEIK